MVQRDNTESGSIHLVIKTVPRAVPDYDRITLRKLAATRPSEKRLDFGRQLTDQFVQHQTIGPAFIGDTIQIKVTEWQGTLGVGYQRLHQRGFRIINDRS